MRRRCGRRVGADVDAIDAAALGRLSERRTAGIFCPMQLPGAGMVAVTRRAVGSLVFGLACGGEPPTNGLLLPPVVASSKYIDYGAWADTSVTCMDDRLAVWDRFVEDVSAYLEVAPPARRIRYTWVPEAERDEGTWPCQAGAAGCARVVDGGEYQSIVSAGSVEMLHELVHAVETPAFGRAHRIFEEGMAEYLSERRGARKTTTEFRQRFAEVLEHGPMYSDYSISLHFVGSLLEQDGLGKYREFRALVPRDGVMADFAAAYAEVYGGELDATLAEMATTEIETRGPGLCDAPGEPLAWPTEVGTTEVVVRGECGDGSFFHPGWAEGEPGGSKLFSIDPEFLGEAIYFVALPDEDVVARTEGVNCPGTPTSSMSAGSGQQGMWVMYPGEHRAQVWFPPRPETDGKVTLEVILAGIEPP